MDKLLLTLNKPKKYLHNISVMFFLFFPCSVTFIAQGTEIRISEMTFSAADFSQKLHMIFGRNNRQKNLPDFDGFFYQF